MIDKTIYKFRDPQRGDVIIFHSPTNEHSDYIKRIIGLPGESVEIKDETVYIRQKDGDVLPLDEPYIRKPPRYTFPQHKVTENDYFVLGDNRNNSNDSHNGWTVPRQNIIGKAWLSIWPPDEWGLASNYSFKE